MNVGSMQQFGLEQHDESEGAPRDELAGAASVAAWRSRQGPFRAASARGALCYGGLTPPYDLCTIDEIDISSIY
eukprot:3096794-Pleurochrysis_carterae.AAC.1